jgi:hypothetical protein
MILLHVKLMVWPLGSIIRGVAKIGLLGTIFNEKFKLFFNIFFAFFLLMMLGGGGGGMECTSNTNTRDCEWGQKDRVRWGFVSSPISCNGPTKPQHPNLIHKWVGVQIWLVCFGNMIMAKLLSFVCFILGWFLVLFLYHHSRGVYRVLIKHQSR